MRIFVRDIRMERKVCIGIPVYNGEQYIRNTLDSILNQTFKDFEIIISDNGSIDSTGKICLEYSTKDNRISYIKQTKNIGLWENYFFLLNKSKLKYFMWLPVGDILHPQFIEKNFQILEQDERIVSSIGKLQYIDEKDKKLPETNPNEYKEYPMKAELGKRISFYLRTLNSRNMMALTQTEKLQKSIPVIKIPMEDRMILLNLLKFGDINVIDEVLGFMRTGGISSRTDLIERNKIQNDYGKITDIFPFLPFTLWFKKEFGLKFLLKNFKYFTYLNLTTIWYWWIHLSRKANKS